MHTTTDVQRFLIAAGYLASGEDDGIFGQKTLDAYNRWRASKGKPQVGPKQFTLTEVNADIWPEEQPPPSIPKLTIFDQIGTLVSILNLLKGKTMTSDQITGLIRLLLGLVGGYFVGKGIVTQ